MFKQTLYIANLTPLRGIAAVLVVAFHFDSVISNLIAHNQSHFFEKCYLMVDLFFIMSGFIMVHVYAKQFETQVTAIDYKNFLAARFARIYPLHLVTLLVLMLFYFSLPIPPIPIYAPSAIITNLLLIHSMGFHHSFTWNIPSWSISAEWWAYVLFPFIVPFVYRKKKLSCILMFLIIVLIYYIITFKLSRDKNLNVTFDYGYLRGLAGFFTGVVLYQFYKERYFYKFLKTDYAFIIAMPYLVFMMHFGANDLQTIPGFILLVISIVYNEGFVSKWFNSSKMQYVGDISYSIYMVQGIMTFLVFIGVSIAGVKSDGHSALLHLSAWKSFAWFFVYLTILLLTSAFTFAKIEKPARKWINKKFIREKHVTDSGSFK